MRICRKWFHDAGQAANSLGVSAWSCNKPRPPTFALHAGDGSQAVKHYPGTSEPRSCGGVSALCAAFSQVQPRGARESQGGATSGKASSVSKLGRLGSTLPSRRHSITWYYV